MSDSTLSLVRPLPRCEPWRICVSNHFLREDTAMRFWKRSIRQDDRSHRDFTRARGPSRKRRLQLESLEGRTLLSTYTISEFSFFGGPAVQETINGNTTYHFNASSPFVVTTGSGTNTVNILNTSAGIAIDEIGGGYDTVNVGSGGS